jgi:serine/threonine-protein kinase
MLPETGGVKVADFGLARATASDSGLTMTGAIMGTPDYMAPEQARGNPRDVDARSDVFGVGALLFEVLAGHGPFGPGTGPQIVERSARGDVLPIDEACERIPVAKRIRAIAERATQPEPAKRYKNITELQEAMRAFLHGGLHLPRKTFAAGEIIFREGDKGDAAYMIVEGRCRAFRTSGEVEETLAVMEPGDAFGEMALILFEPRAATVVALEDATVLVLDQATMNEGLGLSGWTGALVRALAQRFLDLEQMVRTSGIRRGG